MKIGRIVHVLTDSKRTETLQEQGGSRRYPISIFYPAAEDWQPDQQASLLSFFQPAVEIALSLFENVGIKEDHLHEYPFSIYNEAPVAPTLNPLPVVLLSPGIGVDRDLYVGQITALVEAGFLVVTVGATYDTIFTVFPDGDVIRQSERVSGQDFSDFESLRELARVRTEDVRYVLDQLSGWNESEEHPLRGKFDLEKIGVIGHSLGGVGVWEAAREDERVRTVVLLDASLHLPGFADPVHFPVLQVRQEAASLAELLKSSMREEIARAYAEGQGRLHDCLQGDKSFVKILGADHMTFSTVPALFGRNETLERSERAIQAVTVAFLQEHLAGQSGVYRQFLTSVDRPKQVVEIDRDGVASK